ncbi:MAG: LysM peptidoglycan-binding domain-containing protein [Saprospiraceae bacterium]
MKNGIAFLCFLFITNFSVQAQCPVSTNPNIHVVQQDENLYRIARKYNISLDRLLMLNNMREDDLLPACKKLIIRATQSQPQTTTSPAPARTATTSTSVSTRPDIYLGQKQAGNRHTVQPGETMAGLARLYGYTEERFREFNAMGLERLTVGSIILSHDCACDRLSYDVNGTPPGTINNPPEIDVTSTWHPPTTTYYDDEKPARINTQTKTDRHSPISPTDVRKNNTSTTTSQPSTESTRPTSSSMKSLEMDMLTEINLLRSNPSAYISYVDTYVANEKASGGFPIDMSVVNELKGELRKLGKLSQLAPKECVYTAAVKHGQDCLKMNSLDHVGSDKKWPWDRILRECPDLKYGTENLVGGPDNVRESVIVLLIDEGIPSRGHRKALLNPEWKYAACHKVGTVGGMPHCWIQKFGH